MTANGGGAGVQGGGSRTGGGQASAQPAVRIDRDVLPAWETEALPEWVVNWLIPMLSAGQKWPEASESGLSTLAQAYESLAAGAVGTTPRAGAAVRALATGWEAPATANFVDRAKSLYGHNAGLAGVSGNAQAYSQQASNFAVESQYSKLSINVAFWVTVVAIAIALIVAFFSAGSSTAIIGPTAAGLRAAISRILVRLMTMGARELGTTQLARVTVLTGATGRGLLARVLASSIGRELIEEIGEEFFIDAVAQYQQIQMGTRKEWDWQKSQAAIIGAGTGALVGTKLAGPVSRVTRHVPGFAGRALTTGLTNTIASPVGSFLANGMVYGQWQNPFSVDSLMGGFLGGAGRTGSISPFNPEVYMALAHPASSLAAAHDAAARTDASRAGGPPGPPGSPGSPGEGRPAGTGPDGGQPGAPGAVRVPDVAAPVRAGAAPAAGAPSNTTPSAPAPDDPARRSSAAPDHARGTPSAPGTGPAAGTNNAQNTDPNADPDADQDQDLDQDTGQDTGQDTDPEQVSRKSGAAAPESGADPTTAENPDPDAASPAPDSTTDEASDTTAQPDGPSAQTDENAAQPDAAAQTGESAAQPDAVTTQPDAVTTQTNGADTADTAPPAARARVALIGALTTDFADAVLGPSGDLLVPAGNGGVRVIPAALMSRIRAALDMLAEDVQDPADLQAEAVAMLTIAEASETVQDVMTAQDGESVPAYTSKPGTVTSRTVAGTRYVNDGREGPDLELDEVWDAVRELLAGHFLDQGVISLTLSQDGRTLIVRTETNGTHHFRAVVGNPHPELMAETKVRTGTEGDPHLVHFGPRIAGDQLARVWLHEITDTLQEVASPRRQGVLRRKGDRGPTQNACLPAQLNELAFLAEKWRQATTVPEQRLLAVDIDGLARKVREHGETPPLPPWAPQQATRSQQAPDLLGDNPAAQEVRKVIAALEGAEHAIQQQIAAKTASAEEAGRNARKATRQARRAQKQHDQGRFERARKARQQNRSHRATQARHARIAAAYEAALTEATRARQAYEQLLAAMSQAGRPAQYGEVGMDAIAARLSAEATRRHQGYLDALTAALPHELSLSTAVPAGRLAHLGKLTATVNGLLARNGNGHQFTADELERALRADFHKVVSPDGVVLRVGEGAKAAEVRVRLTLSDLVEVLDPGIKASEMMVGLFFQSGRTVSATEAGSGGFAVGFNTGVLAQFMNEGEWPRTVTELLGVEIAGTAGRNWSASGGAGTYAQGGAVSDNRGESLLFDAAATWTVEIRTRQSEGWRDTTTVSSGDPGDASSQRLWVSHSFTDQPPRKLAWVDDARRNPEMPNHVLTSMSDMEATLDQIADALGGDYARIGSVPRDKLRMFLTNEFPHRLRDAVNGGFDRTFTRGGQPHSRVRAETRVVLVASEPLGGPSAEEFEEEVLVDFVALPGGASSGGSIEVSAEAGVNHDALKGVDVGPYQPTIGPKAKGARSASRSYGATAAKQAIHPSVHRKTAPKQSYRLVLETTFIVEEFGKPPVRLRPVRHTAVVSMRESAAYRFGLPVDRAALIYQNGVPLLDADGNQVLRGDPRPGPPPGRRAELPEWLGDGPGQMRGAGPALVQEISGLRQVRQDVLDKLAERGIIPKIVNGVPQYDSNRLVRASQILNLQEVEEQLSDHRIRSAYDSLAQGDDVGVDLELHGLNAAPEHYVLRVSLQQDFSDTRYIGYSDTETVVNLDIGSDTSARSVSHSRTYAGNASVRESDGPDGGHDGLSHGVGVNSGGSHTRTTGSSDGGTVNVVTLQENTGPVAIFSVAHDLKVELLHNGETEELASGRGSARLLFAADLLPSATPSAPAPLGTMSKRLLSRAKLLHMDAKGVLDTAQRVLPRGMRADSVAFQHLTAFLNVRNLVAHPKVLRQAISTRLGIRADGTPTRSELTVAGEVGETEVLAVVDHVNGNILFGLSSAGVSWSGSTGHTTGVSTSAGDLDNGGTASDSGSLGLPSRSGGTSNSTSILDIWGTEELTIETGRQYILRAAVNLTLTGSESAANMLPVPDRIPLGQTLTDTAQGTALFSLPEYDALLMYAEGDLDLPSTLVSDAIERLLNGNLDLDKSVAVPLVQRYVKEIAEARAAGEDVSHAARHTPKALLGKLRELTGLGRPGEAHGERQLSKTLSEATELIDRARDVVLAAPYDRTVGVSTVESLDLTDAQGEPVALIDAVRDAVRATAPDALTASPTLTSELDVDFSDDAALIRVTDMWSPRGFEKSYHVRTGTQVSQTEEVTVRVRLEPDDGADPGRGRFLTHTSQAGIIVQHYRYNDRTHSESYNGSYSAGLDYGNEDHADGSGLGVGTDRSRSYSGSVNQQSTRVQRTAQFNGLDRVQQNMRLVIEVERRPVHTGRFRGRFKAASLRRITRATPPVVYHASLVRRIPTGMIRPADQDPGPVVTVPDPREVELHPGHFPEALWQHPDRPTLLDVVTARLSKMLGAKAVEESRSELVRRLSPSALLSAFERMAGPDGAVLVRTARPKFHDQGTQVNIRARMSDLTVVSGPFDAEKGQVDRKADAQNVTVSRGRVLPVGANGNMKDGQSGFSGRVQGGEQASESVTDHHGARRERSGFETGKAYTVRLRVDYDLTFQHMARLRDGNEHAVGKPVHLPSATSGEVYVTLFGEEIEELRSRMEAGVRLAPPRGDTQEWPTFPFAPGRDRHGLIQILGEARLAARERGAVARVAVREADGIHRYRAAPDGSLYAEQPDGGFAEAFTTLSPEVLNAADQAGVDLRDVFMNSEEPGTFTQQVVAALAQLGVAPAEPGDPVWPAGPATPATPAPAVPSAGVPAPGTAASGTAVPGTAAPGTAAPGAPASGVPSPAIEGTPFSRSARPAGVPDLSLAEVRGQPVTASDLGGAAANLNWPGDDVVALQIAAGPDENVRVLIEDPGEGLNAATELRAGTPEDPHLLRIWKRVHPDLVSSILVHELSHVAQAATAAAAGAPQGVIRTSLSEQQAEGTDHCLIPRLNEHAHLSQKWRAAGDTGTRARLADAIDAIATDVARRGHTPPPPPWGTGPRVPPVVPPQGRIARLLNSRTSAGLDTSAAGLARLAETAGVAGVAPVAGRPDEFTVTVRGDSFTLALTPGAPDAAEVTVAGPQAPDRLVLQLPGGGGAKTAIAVAERVAAHAATMPGHPAASSAVHPAAHPARPAAHSAARPAADPAATVPGQGPARVAGEQEAVLLARIRGLVGAVAEAGPLDGRAWTAALRAEVERAGLAPGQPGSAARLVALARAGELTARHVEAIRGPSTLPEAASARAMARGAALMGARVHVFGPGLMDIVLPGRAPIPVEVRSGQDHGPGPGMLAFQVDDRRTVGANERAAAATAAAAVAAALGAPAADNAAMAELHEAVRQARAATAAQRPARLGVLFDLVTAARPEMWRLIPAPVAAELTALADGRRPRDWPAYLNHLRVLANTTGWFPDQECRCPAGEPCTCGLRAVTDQNQNQNRDRDQDQGRPRTGTEWPERAPAEPQAVPV
ncbi:WXG100-like domain-containing protein [Nonomuraea zeae]